MVDEIDTGRLEPLFGEERGDVPSPLIIAGPCAAESRGQVLESARQLAAAGVRYFRAGVWKPRTRPGSFEGVGAKGLAWLAKARDMYGVVPLTEIAGAAHLRSALRHGLDAFWIGARTSANPFAVQEIADTIRSLPAERRERLTVLVKNPVNPDIELWIGELQRICAAGVRRLGAVHRGFSVYGEHLYRNPPEWSVPIELKRRFPELPLLCDPSHIAGRRDLVGRVVDAAMNMNFDGLMIEVHCDPDSALSDRLQQITPAALAEITGSLGRLSHDGSAAYLTTCRDEIDGIDSELVALLARRMEVSRRIGELKRREGLAVVQPDRYRALMESRVEEAAGLGLSRPFMRRLLGTIHDESVRCQIELPEKGAAAHSAAKENEDGES